MRLHVRSVWVSILLMFSGSPALAWGPVTQMSVVIAAAHVLSREDYYPVTILLEYVREGAQISEARQSVMHPLFEIDPVGAIQREMVLLQSMRGDRVDPYFAYRLGVLGKLVARATAPLAKANAGVRAQYYADVERLIGDADLQIQSRRMVDPRAYFARVRADAQARDDMIVVDYQGGLGFRGLAGSALSLDASRSVNAVADVWYTILASGAVVVEISPSNMRDYVLGAIEFYLGKQNLEEVESAYSEAKTLGLVSTDIQKTIGDLFFDADYPQRAIEEYRGVLASTPGRRDVTERISSYYELLGDEALARQDLEDARAAFATALEADSLHPTAQRKLLDVEAQIFARDERLISQRSAVEEARLFENRAEEAAGRRDYARAITLLREAEHRYASVSSEFLVEARTAALGRRNVDLRMRELKDELIANAQSLSGSGFRFDAQGLAAHTQDLSEQALREMLTAEYASALKELSQRISDDLEQVP